MLRPRKKSSIPFPPLDQPFVAIDFETADYRADSACAVGLVRVENLIVVAREAVLIRPPRERVLFTSIHGITWAMVRSAPLFRDAWPRLAPIVEGAAYFAAHYAPFDRGVLTACCTAARMNAPAIPFVCSVQLARKRLALRPANLPAVCRVLGIDLKHHDAGSDAEACARIVIAAARLEAGVIPEEIRASHPPAPAPRRDAHEPPGISRRMPG